MSFRALWSVTALTTMTLTALQAGTTAAKASEGSYLLAWLTMPDETRRVVRWNPCQPAITYQVNVDGLPTRSARLSAIAVTQASVARVEQATGIGFDYAGTTSFVPRSTNLADQSVAEIVVAFVEPSETDYPLEGETVGYGGWQAVYTETAKGTYRTAIARGFVVIDQPATKDWPNGVHLPGLTRANLISHELGHAVGLGHVDDDGQLMNSTLLPTAPAGFADGDLAGLASVGVPAGCIEGVGDDLM